MKQKIRYKNIERTNSLTAGDRAIVCALFTRIIPDPGLYKQKCYTFKTCLVHI